MPDIPKITGGSSFSPSKLPLEVSRELIDTSEEITGLYSEKTGENFLRRLSKKELGDVKQSWIRTEPREILILDADPKVMKPSRKALTNSDFNAQMKNSIGSHRKK